MSDTTTPIERAAIQWWRMHRPIGMTYGDHLALPEINMSTEAEKALALAVADFLDPRNVTDE